MNLANATRLIQELPGSARVLDVGGGASPFPRADYVIDSLPFSALGSGSDGNVHQRLDTPRRFAEERWVVRDLCGEEPWPFADGFFDYVICSHVLEDLRDPVRVCAEIQRVGRAGYIEVPSRALEQSLGVEHPCYAGYYHHRWLITVEDGRLTFRHKPHSLHSLRAAIVARVGPTERIRPSLAVTVHEWEGTLRAGEVLDFSEAAVMRELAEFAASARRAAPLTESRGLAPLDRARRHVWSIRQRLGWT